MRDEMAESFRTQAIYEKHILRPGQKITIINIDDMMAMCHRTEGTVKSVLVEPIQCGYQKETTRHGTFTPRGKRKEFYISTKRDYSILLDGWNLLRVDSDGSYGVMRGNACFNFVGDADTIKAILGSAIIPLTDGQKAKCILCDGDKETLLWPEIETAHAVINQMKEVASVA